MDSEGLLWVCGRLRKSRLFHSEDDALVLPNQSNILEAIKRWSHEIFAHGGRGMTLNNLRQNGFWILRANVVVRGIIYRCADCRKHVPRSTFDVEKMADLPEVRYLEVRPFTNCGVDIFGPCTIREKWSDWRGIVPCLHVL